MYETTMMPAITTDWQTKDTQNIMFRLTSKI